MAITTELGVAATSSSSNNPLPAVTATVVYYGGEKVLSDM
jgi:hypothetical protein